MKSDIILAQTETTCQFLDCVPSPFGSVIITVLRIIGAFVLIGGVFKAVSQIAQGALPRAMRNLALTLVLVTLLFFPNLLGSIINGTSSLIQAAADAFNGLTGGGGGTPDAPVAPVTTVVPGS